MNKKGILILTLSVVAYNAVFNIVITKNTIKILH